MIALDILLQLVVIFGLIFIVGFTIAAINKKFYYNLGEHSHMVCIATGFIGTPIHELSHALMCIIFGHKINEIKLFTPSCNDGLLGYVNHSYNKKNFYQRMGNFFIGIAPIVFGSCLLIGILYLLLPDLYNNIINVFWHMDLTDGVTIANGFSDIFMYILDAFATWQWWVFLLIGFFVGMHMTLSKQDIENSKTGIFVCILAIVLVNLVCYFIDENIVGKITSTILSGAMLLLCFFSIILVMMLVLLIISYVVRAIKRR